MDVIDNGNQKFYGNKLVGKRNYGKDNRNTDESGVGLRSVIC